MRFLLVLSFVAFSSLSLAEPVEWPVDQGGNGNFYEWVAGSHTWYEAEAAASALTWQGAQGHLAVVTSAEENAWIWDALGEPFQAYLGGVQSPDAVSAAEGWSWVTDEPWDFTNWWPNEPNDAGTGNEWALHFAQTGAWNDMDGSISNSAGMIVEYELGVVGTETSAWGAIKALYSN